MLDIGMEKKLLPLGRAAEEPHIPIWTSPNIATAPRVIVVFGQSNEDLGIFAQRIIGLNGGINAGSTVNFCKAVRGIKVDAKAGVPIAENSVGMETKENKVINPYEIDLDEDEDGAGETTYPGIILANIGQLRWARSVKKPMTRVSWDALTRPSAVYDAVRFDPIANTVEGHRNEYEHVGSILTSVIPELCRKDVKLDAIAIGDACEHVPAWMDANWDKVKYRIDCMACVIPDFSVRDEYFNPEFKDFLRYHTRGFLQDQVETSKAWWGPDGGPERWQRKLGYNVYTIPGEVADEMVFPRQFKWVLEWMQQVGNNPEWTEDEIKVVALGGDDEPAVEEERTFVGADYWDTEEGKTELTARPELAKKTQAERIKRFEEGMQTEEDVMAEKDLKEAEEKKKELQAKLEEEYERDGWNARFDEVQKDTWRAEANMMDADEEATEMVAIEKEWAVSDDKSPATEDVEQIHILTTSKDENSSPSHPGIITCTKATVEAAAKGMLNSTNDSVIPLTSSLSNLVIASKTALPKTPAPAHSEPVVASPDLEIDGVSDSLPRYGQ